jgi:hypothetical protein
VTIGARPPTLADGPTVHAFLDLSNIWYGLLPVRDRLEPGEVIRLSAENLGELLRAGRSPFRLITVANADIPQQVIGYFRRVGEVLLRESGRSSGTEQANDETLQVRMYETLHQHPRGVIVLATGDGAGWAQRRGFVPALDAALQHRWQVELVSWGGSTNAALVDWVRRVRGVFVDLERHYYSVSFVEGGRHVQAVSLRNRATVSG